MDGPQISLQIANSQNCGIKIYFKFVNLPQMWQFANLQFADNTVYIFCDLQILDHLALEDRGCAQASRNLNKPFKLFCSWCKLRFCLHSSSRVPKTSHIWVNLHKKDYTLKTIQNYFLSANIGALNKTFPIIQLS